MENIPNSFDAEMSVLSGMLTGTDTQSLIVEKLTPEQFYNPKNRLVYDAMVSLWTKNIAIDLVTIMDELKGGSKFDNVGVSHLSAIADYAPLNIEHYCDIVHEKYLARRLIDASYKIIDTASNVELGAIHEVLDIAEANIFDVATNINRDTISPLPEVIVEEMNSLEERLQSDSYMLGVHTGINRLDKVTSGLKDGNLIVLAGRPSMGKTALALNIAQYAAITHGVKTGFFSLEMSKGELAIRMLAAEARVNSMRIMAGILDDTEKDKVGRAAKLLATAGSIYIDDTAGCTPLELRAKARRISKEHGLDLIIVDYLQLMSGIGGNREQEISSISRSLKALAKELRVPVLAVSQLSRSCEAREDKRPILSDLRESGAIEQDADVVMFVYREEVYTGPQSQDGRDVENEAELLVSKQRNGMTGIIKLRFEKEYTRFVEK